MRVKDCYSLCLDGIVDEIPTAENLPSRFECEIHPVTVYGSCNESLNIFKAFANYIVERNRTRDLARQIDAAEAALDARNDVARNQSQIIVAEYAERLNNFLATKRQELALETQRIELESADRVNQIQNDREREHRRISELIEVLKYYRSFLEDVQKFLAEVEDSPEKFVTKNKFYHQAKEDCRVKIKWIGNLLKRIDDR